jgi:hypothetical protein
VYEGVNPLGSAIVNGASNWSVTITFADGPHTITARATDLAGNVGPVSAPRSFTMSLPTDVMAPPAPAINDPAAGSYQPAVVTFRGTGEPYATVVVVESGTIGSATANGFGDWTFAATLSNGPHTVTAYARDPAGNIGPSSPPRSFIVDGTRPVVGFTSGANGIFLPGQPVALTGSASDDYGVQRIELEIDDIRGERVGSLLASCSGCPGSPVTWSHSPSLGPGIYEVRVYAVDRAGNRSQPAETTIYVL